jgi:tRNA pseudouridine synthase 10
MIEKIKGILQKGFICNSCLGRQFAELLSGFTNEQRGRTIRQYVAMLIDSGDKIDVDMSNFYGIKFRNVKIKPKKPKKCKICKNFFLDKGKAKIDKMAERISKKLEGIEFDNFLIGTIPSDEMLRSEERLWKGLGIEFVEPIKSEINRELGKRVERLVKRKFKLKNPDVTILVDLNRDSIRLQLKSLYIAGGYKKLVRGIPQTKWICSECKGKGCKLCKGIGKLYKTSVQEQIEKPMIKAAKAKKTKFHGAGREDVDARCLDYRPFVIELVRPLKRKSSLRKLTTEINKSKKVKVRKLKFADKNYVRRIKTERNDKTYLAEVTFSKNIDKKKVKLLKQLTGEILQKTPQRVVHRRANKIRKRRLKSIRAKVTSKRKVELKIRAEAGLYIKELITGDKGRTKLNVSDLMDNKVKKISLDVIKIHK